MRGRGCEGVRERVLEGLVENVLRGGGEGERGEGSRVCVRRGARGCTGGVLVRCCSVFEGVRGGTLMPDPDHGTEGTPAACASMFAHT